MISKAGCSRLRKSWTGSSFWWMKMEMVTGAEMVAHSIAPPLPGHVTLGKALHLLTTGVLIYELGV